MGPMKHLFLFLLMTLLLLSSGQAQERENTGRRKYYSVEELILLIERAREAGVSEENLKKLEIRDGDREINVFDYIAQEKMERLKKDKILKDLLSKRFLTVNDIYTELIKSEPQVIQKLREELVSER